MMSAEFRELLISYSRADTSARRQQLEQQLWQHFGCEKAVLVLDMAGFSILCQRYGIVHYLAMITRMQLTVQPIIESHQGQVIKFEADNCFAIFDSCLLAVRAALAMNYAFRSANLLTVEEQDIRIACGLDYGRILLIENRDLFGNAVNRASKLGEDTAEPSEILVTKEILDNLPADAEIRYELRRVRFAGKQLRIANVLL